METSIEAETVVAAVQELLEDANAITALDDASVDRRKQRIVLKAGVGAVNKTTTSQTREPRAGKATLTSQQQGLMRSTLDKLGSRDSNAAFHLKSGDPQQWPLAIEGTVATVKLQFQDVDELALRSAITK